MHSWENLLKISASQGRMSVYKRAANLSLHIVNHTEKFKLDRCFANTIINDWFLFSTWSIQSWALFWKFSFGGSWRPPFPDKIYGELLDNSYQSANHHVIDSLSNLPTRFISVNIFSYINSKSLFNIMIGALFPLFQRTFLLKENTVSESNLHSITHEKVDNAIMALSIEQKIFGFCSDSSHKMATCHKLLCGGEMEVQTA